MAEQDTSAGGILRRNNRVRCVFRRIITASSVFLCLFCLSDTAPALAAKPGQVSLKQWAHKYGNRFQVVIVDLGSLRSISAGNHQSVLQKIGQDAKSDEGIPVPVGVGSYWRIILANMKDLSRSVGPAVLHNNKKELKVLQSEFVVTGRALNSFTAPFFAAGISVGNFSSTDQILGFFESPTNPTPATSTTTTLPPTTTVPRKTTTTTAPTP